MIFNYISIKKIIFKKTSLYDNRLVVAKVMVTVTLSIFSQVMFTYTHVYIHYTTVM